MRIPSEVLSRISSAVLRLYAPSAPSEIPAKFFAVIRDLIECEHLSYNEFSSSHVSCLLDPVIDPAISEAWVTLVDQHPTISYIKKTSTTDAVKISDFVTGQQWRRSEIFNEVFAKLHVEHQLGFMFSIGDTKFGFAANRRRCHDFTETHRFILSFLASHLSQAIQNSMALARMNERMHHLADLPTGGGVIVFSDEGTILFCSRKAADCVGRFFETIGNNKLPDELCRWLSRGISKPTVDDMAMGALHPFTKEISDSVLTVRVMPNHSTNEHTLVLEENTKNLQYSVLKDYGLTSREAEVLNWVTQGKTNPEIAIILDISVRTVGHHIEHIMSKLGVERRGAAALWAQQTMALRA